MKLKITLPSEEVITLEFNGNDSFSNVHSHVKSYSKAWNYSIFTLMKQNPRTILDEKYFSMSLNELGLNPEANLKCTLGQFHS